MFHVKELKKATTKKLIQISNFVLYLVKREIIQQVSCTMYQPMNIASQIDIFGSQTLKTTYRDCKF